jgi:hypothetical protein
MSKTECDEPTKNASPFPFFFLLDNDAITSMRLDGIRIGKKILIDDPTDQYGKEITEY